MTKLSGTLSDLFSEDKNVRDRYRLMFNTGERDVLYLCADCGSRKD
jgi:hypothetical protein